MKKTLLAGAFILLFFSMGMAQERGDTHPTISEDPVILGRYQIGINSQFAIDGLLEQNIRTPVEILVRRQTGTGAVRVRISGISNHSRTEDPDILNIVATHQSTLGLALGYEWHRKLKRNWSWYYGLELEGSRIWDNSKAESLYQDQSTLEEYIREEITKRRTNSIGLLPFIGFKYRIIPRLYVSTEIKMLVYHKSLKNRRDTDYFRLDGSFQSNSYGRQDIKNQSIIFQPYTGILINFIL